MKKLLASLFILFVGLGTIPADAISYEDAINQKAPCAVLLYASWADDINQVVPIFSSLEQQYADKYNFVRVDIASEQAKVFNKTNYIYPNLPYIMLYKERGRISRYIQKDCITKESCIKEKMDVFAD